MCTQISNIGTIGVNQISFESLRNAGVLSVGSLHVCLGALRVSAVVKGILVRRIQEAIQLCTICAIKQVRG